MTHEDAVAFLGTTGPWQGAWADVGAGAGTFTRALAALLGPTGTVFAIDRDAGAAHALQRVASQNDGTSARIIPAHGDMHDFASIRELSGVQLDGALFANALHFTNQPATVLGGAAESLRPGGRIVVIEYDTRRPNPWVPHPLAPDRLADVARRAGLGRPEEVARRPSAYHRAMYCAVLVR